MIKAENLTVKDKQFVHTYSDIGCMVERDGVRYAEAIDPAEFNRQYTETDELVKVIDETEEKALAYDILMGGRMSLMDNARKLRLVIEKGMQSIDGNDALAAKCFYPKWDVGTEYTAGFKVQHDGKLWKCRQAHSAIVGWEPPNVASLWEQVCESHTGTEDDPIPYEGNMALTYGLYYTQELRLYRCIRDSINPVYHRLEELVGLYVEEVI